MPAAGLLVVLGAVLLLLPGVAVLVYAEDQNLQDPVLDGQTRSSYRMAGAALIAAGAFVVVGGVCLCCRIFSTCGRLTDAPPPPAAEPAMIEVLVPYERLQEEPSANEAASKDTAALVPADEEDITIA